MKGDLISLAENGKFNVIVHGCNCFNNMGAGIALTIKNKYPLVYKNDCSTAKGDKSKLGTINSTFIPNKGFIIVNAYTQYRYGNGINVDYDAIRECFKMIAILYPKYKIGYPKIGAGFAGGDWSIISNIINEELKNLTHTLVIYEQ